jgi:hypothetical protein
MKPTDLTKRANALAADSSIPLGTTESFPLPGVVTMIRVEPQIWGRNDKGDLVQGCFRVGSIYLPAASSGMTFPPISGWSKAGAILTVLSLSVGTVATVVSMRGGR